MNEPLGNRLRSWRQEKKLSTAQVASRIGCSDATVLSWEHNKTNPRRWGGVDYADRVERLITGETLPDIDRAKPQETGGKVLDTQNPQNPQIRRLRLRFLNANAPYPTLPTSAEFTAMHTIFSVLHASAFEALSAS